MYLGMGGAIVTIGHLAKRTAALVVSACIFFTGFAPESQAAIAQGREVRTGRPTLADQARFDEQMRTDPPRLVNPSSAGVNGIPSLKALGRSEIVFLARKYTNPAVDLSYELVPIPLNGADLQPSTAEMPPGALFAVLREDQTDTATLAFIDDTPTIYRNQANGGHLILQRVGETSNVQDLRKPRLIRDAVGNPIVGAKVHVQTEPLLALFSNLTTDEKGEVSLANARISVNAISITEVRIEHPEYGSASAQEGIVPLTRAGSPERAESAKGVVVDAAGNPVAGANVAFSDPSIDPLSTNGWNPDGAAIFTNARGEFAWHPIDKKVWQSPKQQGAPNQTGDNPPLAQRIARVRVEPPADSNGAVTEPTIGIAESAANSVRIQLPAARRHRFAFEGADGQPTPVTASYAIGYYPPDKTPALTQEDPGILIPSSFVREGGPMAPGVYWAFQRGVERTDYAPIAIGPDFPEQYVFAWKTKNIAVHARAVEAVTGEPVPYALMHIGSMMAHGYDFAGNLESVWQRKREMAQRAAKAPPQRIDREPFQGQTWGGPDTYRSDQIFVAGPDGVFDIVFDPGTGATRVLVVAEQNWLPLNVKLDAAELQKNPVVQLGDLSMIAAARPDLLLDRNATWTPLVPQSHWEAANLPPGAPMIVSSLAQAPFGKPFISNRLRLRPNMVSYHSLPASTPLTFKLALPESETPLSEFPVSLGFDPKESSAPIADAPYYTYPETFLLSMSNAEVRYAIGLPSLREAKGE